MMCLLEIVRTTRMPRIMNVVLYACAVLAFAILLICVECRGQTLLSQSQRRDSAEQKQGCQNSTHAEADVDADTATEL